MMNSHAANASPRCALVTRNQHDLVGGRERADAMNHERVDDVPARFRLVDDGRERLLGHAGVMLERQRCHRRLVVDIADRPDEHGDGADAPVAAAQRGELARDVEVGGLDADRHRARLPLIRR